MKLRITIDGKTYAADIEIVEEEEGDGNGFAARTTGAEPDLALGAYKPTHSAEGHSLDEKIYRSPVNGLVIRVNVKPGQIVQYGDVMLVLEAMKMETSVAAHRTGRVKSVHATAGQSVKLHQALVELE